MATDLTPLQLANVNKATREMIRDYLARTGISLSQFSKDSKCSQSQLWIYLNTDSKRGVHSCTLEKIGRYLNENK